MCDGRLLPHCGHLFSCEACQRFAAFRVRNRIFDVLRFGTPMAGAYKSIFVRENNVGVVEEPRHSELSRGIPLRNLEGIPRDPLTPLRSAQDDFIWLIA